MSERIGGRELQQVGRLLWRERGRPFGEMRGGHGAGLSLSSSKEQGGTVDDCRDERRGQSNDLNYYYSGLMDILFCWPREGLSGNNPSTRPDSIAVDGVITHR